MLGIGRMTYCAIVYQLTSLRIRLQDVIRDSSIGFNRTSRFLRNEGNPTSGGNRAQIGYSCRIGERYRDASS